MLHAKCQHTALNVITWHGAKWPHIVQRVVQSIDCLSVCVQISSHFTCILFFSFFMFYVLFIVLIALCLYCAIKDIVTKKLLSL